MGVCLSQVLIESYVSGNCSSEQHRLVETSGCVNCSERIEAIRSNSGRDDPTIKITAGEQTAEVTRSLGGSDSKPAVNIFDKDFESVFENYEILGKIGSGGFGTVWRALQLSTQREVALKVLGAGTFASPKARARFEREVELTARLVHPNIARIYDSGLHRGIYYYTMELFEGDNLDRYIKRYQLSDQQILELMSTVCQAVQYAHQRGVIHRDLKPPNIIVTDDGCPHILDFGLAKAVLDDEQDVLVSRDGDVSGTPAFMSPEQAGGHLDEIDTRTDVYSLGAILYNVFTNDWPYDLSGSHYELLRNIQEQYPTRPSQIVPGFDSEIEAILLKALAKKPEDRYQSAAQLAEDIQCHLQGLPVSARSVDTWYLLRKFISRHRTSSIIAGLLLLILVSNSFISLYLYRQSRRALKKLELEQATYNAAYKEDAQNLFPAANRVLFFMFLESWHDDKDVRARTTAGKFAYASRERVGAAFLLDPGTLPQKEAKYREKLGPEHDAFWKFITAEYYLKQGEDSKAIEAYEQCQQIEEDRILLDGWFANRAQRQLDILAAKTLR
ncbi:MAG: serine/threonine protein kinase [Planctomycetota bacterium]|jgi:serine/threonine protein kinase